MRSSLSFSLLVLFMAGAIEANLRAPVHIERGLSRLMAKPSKIPLRGERHCTAPIELQKQPRRLY